jgi:hypothetical protein
MRRILLLLSVALAAAQTPQAPADLNQLMRGVLYPAANVVFFAQADDPAAVKTPPGLDPSMAVNPLESTFGGWQAVENAALALTESATLLAVPGRVCSNGAPVPLNEPEWATFLQQLRDAGTQAYKAAQAKDQDKMIEVSDTLSNACANCHRRWRDRRTERCK